MNQLSSLALSNTFLIHLDDSVSFHKRADTEVFKWWFLMKQFATVESNPELSVKRQLRRPLSLIVVWRIDPRHQEPRNKSGKNFKAGIAAAKSFSSLISITITALKCDFWLSILMSKMNRGKENKICKFQLQQKNWFTQQRKKFRQNLKRINERRRKKVFQQSFSFFFLFSQKDWQQPQSFLFPHNSL